MASAVAVSEPQWKRLVCHPETERGSHFVFGGEKQKTKKKQFGVRSSSEVVAVAAVPQVGHTPSGEELAPLSGVILAPGALLVGHVTVPLAADWLLLPAEERGDEDQEEDEEGAGHGQRHHHLCGRRRRRRRRRSLRPHVRQISLKVVHLNRDIKHSLMYRKFGFNVSRRWRCKF